MTTEPEQELSLRLNEALHELGEEELSPELADRFGVYVALLIRWNSRTNLTAIRDADGILRRHLAESIACARFLPQGIASLLDFGSGAGLPGIPIALCRPEISLTLAESQGKKAAFLREAMRVLSAGFTVHAGRAEDLDRKFDCVTLRAVDKMEAAVRAGAALVKAEGWIALLITAAEQHVMKAAAGEVFEWKAPKRLPGGDDRILLLGQKARSL